MRLRLTAILLAITSLAAPQAAQAWFPEPRAAWFTGTVITMPGVYGTLVDLYTPGGSSPQATFSFWFASNTPPVPGNESRIIEGVDADNDVMFSIGLESLARGNYVIRIYFSTLTGAQWFSALSNNLSNMFDGLPHRVALTWDLSSPLRVANVGYQLVGSWSAGNANVTLTWPTMRGDPIHAPFAVPLAAIKSWRMGGSVVGTAVTGTRLTDFYNGWISEFYGHWGVADYTQILNAKLPGSPFGMQIGAKGNVVPVELGPFCQGPYGPESIFPMFCLRGGASSFADNQPGLRFSTHPSSVYPLRNPTNPPFVFEDPYRISYF